MLNGKGIENGKKKNNNNNNNRYIILAKQQLCTCSTLFCTFCCRCCLDHYTVKRLSCGTFYGDVVCSHRKKCCLCYCSLSFSLPLTPPL